MKKHVNAHKKTITFTADIGSWERGKTIDLQANTRDEALAEGFRRVDEAKDDKNPDPYLVQLYENGQVIWDYYLLPGMWRQ